MARLGRSYPVQPMYSARSAPGASGPVEIVHTIAASGGDYTSLSAWEAAQQRDLVAANEAAIAECEAFLDTTPVVFDGWTTSETCLIVVRAAAGAEAKLPYSSTAYRLEATNPGNQGVITVSEEFSRFQRIQIGHTLTSDVGRAGIAARYQASAGKIWIDGVVVKGAISGTTNTSAFRIISSLVVPYFTNCVALNYPSSGSSYAYEPGSGPPNAYYYNCSAINCTRGFLALGSQYVAKNCLFDSRGQASPVGFSGTFAAASSNNASTDATAPGSNSRQSQTFTYVDTNNSDYRLAYDDAGARTYGISLTADSINPVTLDVNGYTRTGSWDIGASEAPTVVVHTVAASGGDYTSLNAWEAAQQRDLVAVNQIAVANCQAFVDTATVVVLGWTTAPAHFVLVQAASGAEATVPLTGASYVLRATTNYTYNFDVQEQYVRVRRLAFEQAGTPNEGRQVGRYTVDGASDVRFESCLFLRSGATGGAPNGIAFTIGGATGSTTRVAFVNSLFIGWQACLNHEYRAIERLVLYNNTLICKGGGASAMQPFSCDLSGGAVYLKNNIVQTEGVTSFGEYYFGNGTLTSATNISSDASSPQTGLRNKTVLFKNAAGGNYHLDYADVEAQRLGTSLLADAIYPVSVDFDDRARLGAWDIGATETYPGVDAVSGDYVLTGSDATLTYTPGGGGDTQSINHDPGNGTIVLGGVFVVAEDGTPVVSATFDAEAMTPVADESDAGSDYHLAVLHLSEPIPGVQVFEATTDEGLIKGMAMVSYDEVPLVAPIRASITNSGNSTAPGGTVPGVVGNDKVVAFLSWFGTATLTVDTAGGEVLVTQANSGNHNIAIIEKPGAGGTVVFAPELSTANPWQLVAAAVKSTVSTGYSITAEAGSVILTGADAAVLADRLVVAEQTSYALTGQDAATLKGSEVAADAGSIVVTGQDAILERTGAIAAESGSVVLTGTDANLERGYVIAAEAGAVVITGFDATLGSEARINAESGAIAVTGADATLLATREVAADSGAVNIAGQDANLELGREVAAEAGSVVVSGQDASLELGRRVAADEGALVVTGADATLRVTRLVVADSGTIVITGYDAGLGSEARVNAESGTFLVSGQDANLEYNRRVVAEPGAVAVTGTDASLEHGSEVAADAGAIVLIGQDANLEIGRRVVAELAAVVLTGSDATLRVTRRVVAETGAIIITGFDATLSSDPSINAETGSVALTGSDATLRYTRVMPADAGAVAVTGQQATTAYGRVFAAEAAAFSLTPTDASLELGRKVLADASAFSLAGGDAGLRKTSRMVADPGTLVVTGQDTQVRRSARIAADPANYTLTPQDAGLRAGRRLPADPGQTLLTGQAAATLYGRTLGADPASYTITGQDAYVGPVLVFTSPPEAFFMFF